VLAAEHGFMMQQATQLPSAVGVQWLRLERLFDAASIATSHDSASMMHGDFGDFGEHLSSL
jgi:hypothetical protein